MDSNKLFKEAEKIVPFKRLFPFFILLFTIGAVYVFSKLINSSLPNKEFFEAELSGKINEIKHSSKNNYFQIGTNWYLIKDECIVHFSKGDSISKLKNSYIVRVYDNQLNIKWQNEVQNLIFQKFDMKDNY
jgi:hypothetical protein